MNALTLTVWSLSLGAIAAVAVARVGDLLARPSVSQLRAVSYHVSVFLLVLVLSGVLRQLAHPGAGRLQVLQVLAGPLCVGLSNLWIHGWLGAGHRDRLMAAMLRLSALALPLLGRAQEEDAEAGAMEDEERSILASLGVADPYTADDHSRGDA